ncbi:MAG: hypothetical protein JWQ80_3265 [Massilia sp.]|nr:hypothetical protein [Massilia sp.]
MRTTKKFHTRVERFHAALVETDPAGIDPIRIDAAGLMPWLGTPAMAGRAPHPARECRAPGAGAPRRAAPPPHWRRRHAAPHKSAARA